MPRRAIPVGSLEKTPGAATNSTTTVAPATAGGAAQATPTVPAGSLGALPAASGAGGVTPGATVGGTPATTGGKPATAGGAVPAAANLNALPQGGAPPAAPVAAGPVPATSTGATPVAPAGNLSALPSANNATNSTPGSIDAIAEAATAGTNATVPAGAYLVTKTPTGTILTPIYTADNATASNTTALAAALETAPRAAPAVQKPQPRPNQVAASSLPAAQQAPATAAPAQQLPGTGSPAAITGTGTSQNDYRTTGVYQISIFLKLYLLHLPVSSSYVFPHDELFRSASVQHEDLCFLYKAWCPYVALSSSKHKTRGLFVMICVCSRGSHTKPHGELCATTTSHGQQHTAAAAKSGHCPAAADSVQRRHLCTCKCNRIWCASARNEGKEKGNFTNSVCKPQQCASVWSMSPRV